MSEFFAVLLVGVAILVFFRRRQEVTGHMQSSQPPGGTRSGSAPEPDSRAPGRSPNDEIDRALLEEAEREVRDLENDVKGRPLEDAVGDDWGPGTPKPPYF